MELERGNGPGSAAHLAEGDGYRSAIERVQMASYASPFSELPFLATGFSAVARNALPSLFPACFRWEIQPAPFTDIRCGAIVPMYGQAGGGVEVMFTNVTTNRGPIANPVLVPPY
jgi:hypothetical protein